MQELIMKMIFPLVAAFMILLYAASLTFGQNPFDHDSDSDVDGLDLGQFTINWSEDSNSRLPALAAAFGHVLTPPPHIVEMMINEKNVVLAHGENFQFTVTCLDQYGHSIENCPVEWNVEETPGDITPNGYFTAPFSDCTAIVTARTNGLIDYTSVDVSDPNSIDSDKDGIQDWIEIKAGSNPLDATDFPSPGAYYDYDSLGRIIRIIRIKPRGLG